ncbi:hypothetical protein L0F63_002021 [Massospora cicadina]|nr:hypothetical protein L0F63_002021 [Massospora cicadina]
MNSWESIRNQIRKHRYSIHVSQATFKDFTFGLDLTRLYFVGSPRRSSGLSSIFSIPIPYSPSDEGLDNLNSLTPSPTSASSETLITKSFGKAALENDWTPLLASNWQAKCRKPPSSKALAQQLERRRVSTHGILSYQFIQEHQLLAFPYGGDFYTLGSEEFYAYPKLLQTQSGARINPKVGGRNNDLVAFVRDRDLWVCKVEDGAHEVTLTADPIEGRHDNEPEKLSISNGLPEYVIQAYDVGGVLPVYRVRMGAPGSGLADGLERILYTRVDETLVDLVAIPKSSGHEVEYYRYPRAGTKNATWELRVVEFERELRVDRLPRIRTLPQGRNILSEFPWAEYLVRFGWLPSGLSAWAQILDRRQKHTAVIKIPLECFSATDTEARMEILFEEWTDFWINVTDVFHFFYDTADVVRLIWASERSGFRHLYLVTKARDASWHARPITQGSWPVVEQPIFVDEARSLVYFSGKRESPLETHLYVASFDKAGDAQPSLRLTKPGASYTFAGDAGCRMFVEVASSITQLPVCRVVSPAWQPNSVFPSLTTLCTLKQPLHLRTPEADLPEVEFFHFPTEDGVELHGLMIRPGNWREGRCYPALLSVYGGPKIQAVSNDFKYPKLSRAYLAAKMGFVVVMIDGRGSSDRGLGFEGQIRHHLGELELKDQVAGLRFVINNYGLIDAERVAITGWSYGGYLSLMALVRYPNVFKMAIAGAPVTNWNLYDSAYTERYLGLPHENYCGYHHSSVLSFIDSFPDGENRLLIAHGMIDDNVHFSHTEALVSALISANKPYHLQVYPTERHGFRNHGVSEHFDTLMFYWLRNYL